MIEKYYGIKRSTSAIQTLLLSSHSSFYGNENFTRNFSFMNELEIWRKKCAYFFKRPLVTGLFVFCRCSKWKELSRISSRSEHIFSFSYENAILWASFWLDDWMAYFWLASGHKMFRTILWAIRASTNVWHQKRFLLCIFRIRIQAKPIYISFKHKGRKSTNPKNDAVRDAPDNYYLVTLQGKVKISCFL